LYEYKILFLNSAAVSAYFQIYLGEAVKELEEQIVQMEVTTKFGKNKMPIAFLRQGHSERVSVNVKFSDLPVKLTLVKGDGPVHVIGNHTYGKLTL
jgi:nucleophosmin 3